MNRKYTKDSLEKIASESFSFRQMISKLNLKETGGNYRNIKSRCKEFNVDTSHFFGQVWHKEGHPNFGKLGKSIDDFFKVVDKKIPSSRVKIRLLNNNLKEYICEVCGVTDWQGKRLVIELHHKNGNPCDNRLENLQLLCPNCHSQTHNYCKKEELRRI